MSVPFRPQPAKNPSTSPFTPLHRLGLTNPGTTPNEETALADVLLYALAPVGGSRPDLGIIHGVASHLEALVMFLEGPLAISLELSARSLRVALELNARMT